MMNILVAIDFSDITDAVLKGAKELSLSLAAQLFLVHVVPPEPDFVGYDPGPQSVREQLAQEWKNEHRQLQHYAEQLKHAGISTTALLIQGAFADAILHESERLQANLIILGSHGHSAVYDLLVGSVTQGVLKSTKIPVMVVPGTKC